jgi:exodeoxyribonuclease-3
VRIRIPLLKKLVEEQAPDIICLQETKVEDASFPYEDLKSLGYPHVYFSGQKGYNGMAILSKIPLQNPGSMGIAKSEDKRHLAAILPGGVALHNFYVPAGGDIPDPAQNPAFDFKLRFVEHMTDWAKSPDQKNSKMIIVGDFNIAPQEHDVWSHKQLLKIVSHTPIEIERLKALQATLDWTDVARKFIPATEKSYSWWSYRNKDWKASNRGRRLDHIWVTPQLNPAVQAYHVATHARDWDSPSDHVPILMDIAL